MESHRRVWNQERADPTGLRPYSQKLEELGLNSGQSDLRARLHVLNLFSLRLYKQLRTRLRVHAVTMCLVIPRWSTREEVAGRAFREEKRE